MTLSRRIKLHLVRALIANPEVLIIKRTLQGFNEEVAGQMLDTLRQHVTEKGLCLPEEGKPRRRPRNVVFITENTSEALKADTIFQLDPLKKTVEEISHEALTRPRKFSFKGQGAKPTPTNTPTPAPTPTPTPRRGTL